MDDDSDDSDEYEERTSQQGGEAEGGKQRQDNASRGKDEAAANGGGGARRQRDRSGGVGMKGMSGVSLCRLAPMLQMHHSSCCLCVGYCQFAWANPLPLVSVAGICRVTTSYSTTFDRQHMQGCPIWETRAILTLRYRLLCTRSLSLTSSSSAPTLCLLVSVRACVAGHACMNKMCPQIPPVLLACCIV